MNCNFICYCCFLAITFFACTLEPCRNKICNNGDAQEDFDNCVCLCNRGWTGEFCDIEDKCQTRNVVCKNSGTCSPSTGLCTCRPGYEGDTCDIILRNAFVKSGTLT